MKVEVFSHIWDTEDETGAAVFGTLKEAVESYLIAAREYTVGSNQETAVDHWLGCLRDEEDPDNILRSAYDLIDKWEGFWGIDTHKIETHELEIPVNVYVMVEGGCVQGASSDQPEIGFEVFDVDNKKEDGSYEEEIKEWEEFMETLHPIY